MNCVFWCILYCIVLYCIVLSTFAARCIEIFTLSLSVFPCLAYSCSNYTCYAIQSELVGVSKGNGLTLLLSGRNRTVVWSAQFLSAPYSWNRLVMRYSQPSKGHGTKNIMHCHVRTQMVQFQSREALTVNTYFLWHKNFTCRFGELKRMLRSNCVKFGVSYKEWHY